MIPKSLLLKETLFYAVSKIVPGLAGLASVILFMRIIGAEQYGKYSFLLSQCNLIVAISFGWLNQAQLRYYSKDYIENDYTAGQIKAFVYSSIFSLIVLSMLTFLQTLSIKIWGISIVVILAIGGFNYLKTLYQAGLLPEKIIWLTFLQSLLVLSIPLGLLFLFQKNGVTLLLGVGLSFLLITVLFGIKKNIISNRISNFSISSSKGRALIKKWFLYGSPLSIWFAGALGLPFLDRFFINKYLSSGELGIYASIQELLTRLFSLTLFPLTLALHPRIMNYWNISKKQETIQIIKWGIGIMISIGMILFFIIWYLDTFIFDLIKMAIPQFKSQYKPLIFPLLSVGFLWQFSLLTHKMLELEEKTILMVMFILISLLINIVGNIVFIPRIGLIATAYTAAISALSYCLLTTAFSINSLVKLR